MMAPTDGWLYFLNLSSILITLPFPFYPRGKQEQLLPGHSHVSHRNGIGVNLVFMFDVGNDGCDWSCGLLICRALTSLVVMYVLKLSCSVCWNVGSGPTHSHRSLSLSLLSVSTGCAHRALTYV